MTGTWSNSLVYYLFVLTCWLVGLATGAAARVLPADGLSFPLLLNALDRLLLTSLAVGANESVTGLVIPPDKLPTLTPLLVFWSLGSTCWFPVEAEPNSNPVLPVMASLFAEPLPPNWRSRPPNWTSSRPRESPGISTAGALDELGGCIREPVRPPPGACPWPKIVKLIYCDFFIKINKEWVVRTQISRPKQHILREPFLVITFIFPKELCVNYYQM